MKVENFNSNYAVAAAGIRKIPQRRAIQPQFTGGAQKIATDADVTKFIMELLPGKKVST